MILNAGNNILSSPKDFFERGPGRTSWKYWKTPQPSKKWPTMDTIPKATFMNVLVFGHYNNNAI